MIDINKLHLDLDNPRFVLIKHRNTRNEAWSFFAMRSKYRKQISDLMTDILTNNLRYKHFLLLQKDSENYIVLDGNRRTFVLKFIFNEEFRTQIKLVDPHFFSHLNAILLKYKDQTPKVEKSLQECTYQIESSRAEANITLERIHSNATSDGKTMRAWPTWEERIVNGKPEAIFIFENFKQYGFTIFLEEINKKSILKYTPARQMLESAIFREWLMVKKLPNGHYISLNTEETEKRILTTVLFIIRNNKIKAGDFFYGPTATQKTLEAIKKTFNTSAADFVTNVLEELAKIEIQLNQSQSITNSNTESLDILMAKPRTQAKHRWFPLVTPFLEKNKNSKLYELINSINGISQNKLLKLKLLSFISIRPIVEMFCAEYSNKANNVFENFEINKSQQRPSIYQKIKTIINDISNSEFKNQVDLKPLYALIQNNTLYELNKIIHQNTDFFTTFENLHKYIKIVDAFGETIKRYLDLIKNN